MIKRYRNINGWGREIGMMIMPDSGEWVKYNDIKELIEQMKEIWIEVAKIAYHREHLVKEQIDKILNLQIKALKLLEE